jgi:hypothetical protein
VLVLACLAVSRVCSVEAGKLLAGWMKPACYSAIVQSHSNRMVGHARPGVRCGDRC